VGQGFVLFGGSVDSVRPGPLARFLIHRVAIVASSVRSDAPPTPTETVVGAGTPFSSVAAAMIAKQSPAMHAATITQSLLCGCSGSNRSYSRLTTA